jgi:hypothetical protein
MSASSLTLTPSRLLPAEQGRALPRYDLLGVDRAKQGHLKQMNSHLASFSLQAAGCMAQLFNSAECDLVFQDFVNAGHFPPEEQQFWIEARAQRDERYRVFFSISAPVIYRLAVIFFGGQLQADEAPSQAKTLSDTEQRLLHRLCQYQVDILSSCMGLGDLGWQLTSVPADALPVGPALWSSQATLSLGEHHHQWRLWWLQAETEAQLTDQRPVRGELEQAMAHLPVPLRVVMGQMAMTLADLETLQVGDVLALDMPDLVPALIGSRPCFNGRIAEQKGSLVYQVTAVIEE